MTEAKPKRRPGATPVFVTSLVLFCLLLGLVTHRLAVESGSVASAEAPAAAPPPRKIVIRRVVTTVVPGAPTASAGGAVPSAGGEVAAAPVEAAPAAPVPVATSAS